ncbi:unnamed protein product, partial [marine sediment metagenome]
MFGTNLMRRLKASIAETGVVLSQVWIDDISKVIASMIKFLNINREEIKAWAEWIWQWVKFAAGRIVWFANLLFTEPKEALTLLFETTQDILKKLFVFIVPWAKKAG